MNLSRSGLHTRITLNIYSPKMKPDQHLHYCRPDLPQLMSEFMIQQQERDLGKRGFTVKAQFDNNCLEKRTQKPIWLLTKNKRTRGLAILWTDKTKLVIFRCAYC